MNPQDAGQCNACRAGVWDTHDAPEAKDVIRRACDKDVGVGEGSTGAVNLFDDLDNLRASISDR